MQEQLNKLGKYFKSVIFASILFPIQRFQIIKQIQSSYIDTEIKLHPNIRSRAVKHGIRSYFRGNISSFVKKSILCAPIMLGPQYWYFSNILYLFAYPLEIINTRIASEVTNNRFYSNFREVFSNIKKNQGLKTLFRGYITANILFMVSTFSIYQSFRILQQKQSEKNQTQKILTIVGIRMIAMLILYPFQTSLKLNQMNKAIGHIDSNYSVFTTFKRQKINFLYRGIDMKLLRFCLFGGMFLMDKAFQ